MASSSSDLGLREYLHRLVLGRDSDALSDRQLLDRFVREREEAAFVALVRRHGPMVLGVLRQIVSLQDVDDAFQATFLVLVRKAHGLRQPERLACWLYGVACRIGRKLRAVQQRRQIREGPAELDLLTEPSVDPVVPRETAPVVHAEVEGLPEKYRVPVVLCYLQGKTRTEAARLLGWPEGTVSGRLARARDLLRVRLQRRGVGVPAAGVVALLAAEGLASPVPAQLVESTTHSALAILGKLASAAVPGSVAALTEGVIQGMFWTKIKLLGVAVSAVLVFGSGSGWVAYQAWAGDGPPGLGRTAQGPPTGGVPGQPGPAPGSLPGGPGVSPAGGTAPPDVGGTSGGPPPLPSGPETPPGVGNPGGPPPLVPAGADPGPGPGILPTPPPPGHPPGVGPLGTTPPSAAPPGVAPPGVAPPGAGGGLGGLPPPGPVPGSGFGAPPGVRGPGTAPSGRGAGRSGGGRGSAAGGGGRGGLPMAAAAGPGGSRRPSAVANMEVRSKLNSATDLLKGGMISISLDDALGALSEAGGITIRVDRKLVSRHLRESGLDPTALKEVRVDLDGIEQTSVAQGLEEILGCSTELPLTYLVRGGVVSVVPADWVKPMNDDPLQPSPLLQQPVNVSADDLSLKDVLGQLADSTGANIVLDPRVNEAAEMPIRIQLQQVPLYTAVRLISSMAELSCLCIDNVLFVSLPDHIDRMAQEEHRRLGGGLSAGLMGGFGGPPGGLLPGGGDVGGAGMGASMGGMAGGGMGGPIGGMLGGGVTPAGGGGRKPSGK